MRSLWGCEHGAYSELGELSGWLRQGPVSIGVWKGAFLRVSYRALMCHVEDGVPSVVAEA